jgi:CRISPR-associated protein Csx17
LQLRMIDAANEHQPSPGEQAGAQPAFEFRHSCPYEDVVAYLEGRTDDGRLANLVAACEMLEFSDGVGAAQRHTDDRDSLLPPAYCLLAPFFHGRPIAAGTAQAGVALRPGPSWASLLAAGRVEDVVFDALRRLRVARLTPIVTSAAAMARGADGNRLAAALCFPVSAFGARMLLSRVAILAPRDV